MFQTPSHLEGPNSMTVQTSKYTKGVMASRAVASEATMRKPLLLVISSGRLLDKSSSCQGVLSSQCTCKERLPASNQAGTLALAGRSFNTGCKISSRFCRHAQSSTTVRVFATEIEVLGGMTGAEIHLED